MNQERGRVQDWKIDWVCPLRSEIEGLRKLSDDKKGGLRKLSDGKKGGLRELSDCKTFLGS